MKSFCYKIGSMFNIGISGEKIQKYFNNNNFTILFRYFDSINLISLWILFLKGAMWPRASCYMYKQSSICQKIMMSVCHT